MRGPGGAVRAVEGVVERRPSHLAARATLALLLAESGKQGESLDQIKRIVELLDTSPSYCRSCGAEGTGDRVRCARCDEWEPFASR